MSTSDPQYEQKAKTLNDEHVAANALAVMDAGNAGPTLQALYAKSSDHASRLALGNSFVQAFRAASDQSAAFFASEADWIQAHIVPGTTRSAAYEMLKSKGLTAYNYSFIKGKAIPAPEPPSPNHPTIGAGCDTSDTSSGAWPYKGEPLPKQEGVCAEIGSHRRRSTANPDAEITLGGAFNLMCGWSTGIDISFDSNDRVKAAKIDKPRSTCL